MQAADRAVITRRSLSRCDRNALEIRAKIKATTGLNASAGISYNKFLAKMAKRPERAEWPCRHHAKKRPWLCRIPARQEILRCGTSG
ncbi:Y-family DNA polymerase [Agrobacterium tumefaciens]|uniref:Y-family DNA polymerase n=1 Tax=Agrobacterium tumefaciens TaxID=358 RepID=UPI003593AE4F